MGTGRRCKDSFREADHYDKWKAWQHLARRKTEGLKTFEGQNGEKKGLTERRRQKTERILKQHIWCACGVYLTSQLKQLPSHNYFFETMYSSTMALFSTFMCIIFYLIVCLVVLLLFIGFLFSRIYCLTEYFLTQEFEREKTQNVWEICLFEHAKQWLQWCCQHTETFNMLRMINIKSKSKLPVKWFPAFQQETQTSHSNMILF